MSWATTGRMPERRTELKLPPTPKVRVRAVGPRHFFHEGRPVEIGTEVKIDADVARMLISIKKAELVR